MAPTEIAPDALGRQLKPDGRLVGVYGRAPVSKAMIYHLIEGHMVGRPIFDAAATRAAGLRRAARIRFLADPEPAVLCARGPGFEAIRTVALMCH